MLLFSYENPPYLKVFILSLITNLKKTYLKTRLGRASYRTNHSRYNCITPKKQIILKTDAKVSFFILQQPNISTL